MPSVSLSLGAAGGLNVSSGTADIGGLVANGEETGGKPKDCPRLKVGLVALGATAEGADVDAVGVMGAAPLLNSAHRGHLRLVSAEFDGPN